MSSSLESLSSLLNASTVFMLSIRLTCHVFEKEKQLISSTPRSRRLETYFIVYSIFFHVPSPSPCYIRACHSTFCCIHSPPHHSICVLSLFVSFPFHLIFSRSLISHHFNQNSSWRYLLLSPFFHLLHVVFYD